MSTRHRIAGRTLGRKTNHRIAMFRNMAVSLFTHGQITTTLPKAKAVKPFVEKLITAAKQGDLAARRRVTAELGYDRIMVQSEDADGLVRSTTRPNRPGGYAGKLLAGPKIVKHIFEEIAPRYTDRTGGYTRIIKLARHRIGDGSDLCVLQLVGDPESEGGPQVSGQFSRRREKMNKRMEYAARLRKGEKGGKAEAEGGAAAAVAEAPGGSAGGEDEQAPENAPDTSETVEEPREDSPTDPGDESGGPTPDEQKNG